VDTDLEMADTLGASARKCPRKLASGRWVREKKARRGARGDESRVVVAGGKALKSGKPTDVPALKRVGRCEAE